jgi:carbonic anhydrase
MISACPAREFSAKIDRQDVTGAAVKKVFHFEASRERYLCDAAILWCFDSRFELGFRKFLKRIGVKNSDPIKIAGGAKSLTSPEQAADREFVLDQIRMSMQLHGTRRVILMVHSDCGAYGGLAGAFAGDATAEAAHHLAELQLATNNLLKAIPGIDVQAYFVDFEGIWDAEVETSKPLTEESVA